LENEVRTVPRPLVRTNQWFIVLSVVTTWIAGNEWILAVPLIAGLLGLFIDYNPVMRAARLFLKKDPSRYIPEDYDQQQFNQVISVVCLALGLLCYLLDWSIAAYTFTILVALAAFVAILGFCIGCFIRFQWKQYQYKKSLG
jgi:hypothetical protein